MTTLFHSVLHARNVDFRIIGRDEVQVRSIAELLCPFQQATLSGEDITVSSVNETFCFISS